MKMRAPLCQIPTEAGHRGDAGEGYCCCPYPNGQLQTLMVVTGKRSLWPCHHSSRAQPMYQRVVGSWDLSFSQ